MAHWQMNCGGRITLAIAAVVASGCTTQLETKRIAKQSDVPVAGAPYYLPFTQFSIGITRRVMKCASDTIDIAVIAVVTRLEKPDPQRLYVIDLEALQSAFKKTNVKVSYHANGTLQAVNAAAEDRTGPIVIGAVSTAAKIVVSAATGKGLLQPLTGPPYGCTEDVEKALDTIEKQGKLIEPVAAVVTRLAAELASLTAQAQAMGKAWGPEGRERWAAKMDELSKAQLGLITLHTNVAEALTKVSVTERNPILWPRDGESRGPEIVLTGLTPEQIKQWGEFLPESLAKIKEHTAVFVMLATDSPIGRTVECRAENATYANAGECKRESAAKGLKYRVAADGVLRVCWTENCETPDGSTTVVRELHGPISQFGPVLTLPLRSAVFTNKTVTAVFDEQGRPLELGVVSAAAAEQAVTTAAGVTDPVLKARDSLVTTRLERLKAETEILKAEKEFEAAKKALSPPTDSQEEMAALQADTALLAAQLASLQAQEALRKAQQAAAGP